MSDDRTRIEMEVEVAGTPEEVWEAIATGPGISSWYVPHVVQEEAGGEATARFGEGEGMEVPGRVAAWEPPHRVVFDGGEGVPGLAFEWLVEARDHGTCVVRLVNSGFGDGGEWDDYYDGMVEGWGLFLTNLVLHRAHFPGRHATPLLPGGMLSGPKDAAWKTLTDRLGIPASPALGDRIEATAPDAPPLAGEVVHAETHRMALLLDAPAPGTAFIAVERAPDAEQLGASVWLYLYGDERDTIAARDLPAWQALLSAT